MHPAVEIDYARWGTPRRLDVAGFLALSAAPKGLVVVEEGGLELPMLVASRRSPVTFVGFHAAMHPDRRRALPFFQGRGIAPAGANMVLLTDPSLGLHPAVHVGWFLGNRSFDVAAILPRLLDHLDRLMGAERRLLWGCSAGGTAALRYARAQDVAVAINPQTVIANFTRGRWQPWLEHGWGIGGRDAEQAWLAAHGDLRRTPPAGRVVYVQNVHDDHVARHMVPLLASMGVPATAGEHGAVTVELGDWGPGHQPPPPPVQKRLLAEQAAALGAGGPGRGPFARLRALLARR